MTNESKNLEFSLSAKEICSIIKACRDAGVQTFELGQLHMNFGPEPAKEIAEPQNPWTITYPVSVQTQVDTQSTTNINTQDKEEPDLEDDLLPILDPTQWEENRLKA